jgi:exosortase
MSSEILPATPAPSKPTLLLWGCVLAAACVPLYLVFFVPYAASYDAGRVTLAVTMQRMWGYEQWQHCWLVLPAVAFIVYRQRQHLAALPLKGSSFGGVVLASALFFYWAGFRVENYYVGFFSIQLLIGGLILWLGGWRWMWALMFPFLFLGFAWPLYFLENSITFPLRMVMSNTSVAVLNGIGIDVVRQGTGILSAPDPLLGIPAGKKFSVDVADPCSGIRSLFALMMVSALYGHFVLRTWWQKWILFACSVPLAVLGNLARILMLTLGTMAFGTEFAIGKDALDDPSAFHMGAGYLVFAVALAGMAGIAKLLMLNPAEAREKLRSLTGQEIRGRRAEGRERAEAPGRRQRADIREQAPTPPVPPIPPPKPRREEEY